MINVTKAYLPPIEEYNYYLKKIWENNWLTNHGPLVNELEDKLKKYLGVKHLFFISNGTLALQIAIKALGLKDEVITTPFSYIATTSSLIWEGCSPVFADIDRDTLNIDPGKLEEKITEKTTGMLATHIFGSPCDVDRINEISKKHNIPVVYDAAHSFGVSYKNKSLLNYGDISILSFHATKLFHTVEGGAIVTNDDELAGKIKNLRNFGHLGSEKPEEIISLGINGKNSEFHAAMGLCILPKINEIIQKRKELFLFYNQCLEGLKLSRIKIPDNTDYNYSYYPIIFSTEKELLTVRDALKKESIFPRRYFFPSINTINYIKEINQQEMPISEYFSERILCLPLYHSLEKKDIEKITNIIKKCL